MSQDIPAPADLTEEQKEALRQAAVESQLPPPVDEPPEGSKIPDIPEKLILSGGHYAKLRHPSRLRAKHTRKAMIAFRQTEGFAAAQFAFSDHLLPVVIEEWDLTGEDGSVLPVPTEEDPSPLEEVTTEHMMELVLAAWAYIPILTPPTAITEYSRNWDSPTSASGD